jgi:integrase/recombinase XerD
MSADFSTGLHERHAPVSGLSPRDLDGYLQHLHAKRLSRVSIKIHTNSVRAFIRHAERRGWCTHLLRAGVDINTIRAWLGHVSLDTANIYAEVDLAMKAKALGECSIPDDSRRHWRKEPGLMAFLRSL